MSPRNVRRYSHKVVSTQLIKCELSKGDNSRKFMGKDTKPQPYTDNYRQGKTAEAGRKSFPQRKAHQLAF